MAPNQAAADDLPGSGSVPVSAGRAAVVPAASARPPSDAAASGMSGQLPPAHAMDGSQFHNVIEEQVWSELPPTPEEQMPRRARHLATRDHNAALSPERSADEPTHTEPAQISVGPV